MQWQKTLGGSNDEIGTSVAVAPDGSVYVCGRTYMGNSRGYDLLLAKFNSSGTVQWQKTLGSSGLDIGYSVAVAPDGSVYVCGYTEENTVGDYAFLLAKFSSSGTMQWQKILGSHIKFEMGQYVAVAPDGYVYVCGYTADTTSGNPDLLLVKCSSSGTVQWQKILGGKFTETGGSVAVAPDGSVYACGYTATVGAGKTDLLLAKFSSSGTVQWQKTLGGSNDEIGTSVAVAPDGSVYVCGRTYMGNSRGYDLLLAKFNSSGTVQWQKTLGSSGLDIGYSVAVAPDGSVYVCGYTEENTVGDYAFLLAKFSSSGTMQWQKILGSHIKFEMGQYVAVAPDGYVYVCGYTADTTSGNPDLLLVKCSSSGTVQWQKILGGKFTETGGSVAVAPDGSVYACGYTATVGAGKTDLLLAKFSSSGTVQWQKLLGGSANDYGYSVAVAQDGSVYACGETYDDLLIAKFSSSGTVQWKKKLGGSSRDAGYSVAVAPDGSIYVCGETNSAGAGGVDLLLAKITDSIIEKGTVTFGNFTFKDASLTAQNSPLTVASSSLAVSTYGLTVTTPSLTVGTPSLTTNLYTL